MTAHPTEAVAARRRAALVELARRRRAEPWRYLDPLPGQLRFAQCRDKRKLFRAGNQMKGKTTAGIVELLSHMLGYHPWVPGWAPRFKGPVRCFQIAGSQVQSRAVQRKIAELVPKELLADGCYFDERKGEFKGKYPRLRFKNGSWCQFGIGGGDTISLASETLHVVWIDEPPYNERSYQELERRLTKTGGVLFLTFTPVNRPVQWVKEMTLHGHITDIHDPLTPESLVHCYSGQPAVNEDGTVCDAAWVEAQRETVPDWAAPVLLDGEWDFVESKRCFSMWVDADEGSGGHLSGRGPVNDVRVMLGIDHGTGAGGNACAVLIAIEECVGGPRVWVLDESQSEGRTSMEQDAEAILRMVQRHVTRGWAGLDGVYGDIPVGNTGDAGRKSNRQLLMNIGRLTGVSDVQPRVRTVKRYLGAGGVWYGIRYLADAMVRDMFRVHPRCEGLRESLSNWQQKDRDSRYKHLIDALRYALVEEVRAFGRGGRAGPDFQIRTGNIPLH